MRGGGYETEEDLRREGAVVVLLEDKWKCAGRKLKVSYKIDYALTRIATGVEAIFAFCEIKCVNYPWSVFERVGGYRMSLDKWMSAQHLCLMSGVPFVLVVASGEDIRYLRTEDFVHDGVVWNGRSDRGDKDDFEPQVVLGVDRFRAL